MPGTVSKCFYISASQTIGERETKFLNSQTITDPNTSIEYNENIIQNNKI